MDAPESNAHDEAQLGNSPPQLSRGRILDIIGEFIMIVKPGVSLREDFGPFAPYDIFTSSSEVRLRNSSISQFLESASTEWYHFDPAREHGRIADACLAYLSDYSRSPKKAGNETDLGAFHFVKYASENWYLHSRRRGKDSSFSRELSLLTSERELRDWLDVYDPAFPSRRPFQRMIQKEIDTGFIYAACCGLPEVTRRMLEAGVHVNETGGYLGTALKAASLGGHVEVVKLLLEHGAHVNLRAGRQPLPIVGASLEVTKLLLDHGANVDAGGESHDSAIFDACISGEVEVLKLLLQRGVNMDVVDEESGSLIQVASAHGHIEVIKLLLAHGADVNAREGMSYPPLDIAIEQGNRQLAELLLRSGADFNEGDLARLGMKRADRHSIMVERFENEQRQGKPRFMEFPAIEGMD
jgi:hypothetical protein